MTEDEKKELETLRLFKSQMDHRIQTIREQARIHSEIENRAQNPHAHGFANGLRHCVSILKDEEVRYKEKPEEWSDPYYAKMPPEMH